MPALHDPNNFHGRVNFAAFIIAQGKPTSRGFDGCFENYDGDAVAVALYRRAMKRPDSALARNLWRYLARASVEPLAQANTHRDNLAGWSRELRTRAARQLDEFMKAETYATELTPAGEQTVIPGCEGNAAPGPRQLDLFG